MKIMIKVNFDPKISKIEIMEIKEIKAFQGLELYFSNFKAFPGFSRSAGNPALKYSAL